MEELETEQVPHGEAIEMQIFGDWVGICFQHNTFFHTETQDAPDAESDSTLMLWDYVHGNILGVSRFSLLHSQR